MDFNIENTYGGFIRRIGSTETLHNLAVFVQEENSVMAERKMKLPPGILNEDNELVVRKFTAAEWEEFSADGGKAIEENTLK